MNKYEVGYVPRNSQDGEFFGVYRAETEEEAIREARADLSWSMGMKEKVKTPALASWFANPI